MSDPTDILPPAQGTTPPGEQCPFGAGDVLSQRYAIEQCIGEGTFGWVLSAIDLAGGPPHRVALKVLRSRYANHDEVVRRFERRELVLLRRVHAISPTPHVVRALEPTVLRHGGHPYLALEFIDGPSLHELLDGRNIGLADTLRLGVGMARGLAAIHSAGGVHRDLKPGNIRLRHGREPVIVDLGINRALWETQELTETGPGPMTPRYASPEQSMRGEVGPESDIYSLGIILYEMLTGVVPVAGEDLKAALASGREARTSNSAGSRQPVPPALSECILRCLSRDPRRRPTALEVAAELSLSPGPPSRASRHRRGLLVGVTLLLALVAGLGLHLSRSFSNPPSPPPTKEEPVDAGTPWTQRFGLPASLSDLHLASDSKGNVFVTGAFQGKLELGTGPLTLMGSADVFVARLDAGGRPLWVRRLGEEAWQAPGGIATDSQGHVFVMGHSRKTSTSDRDLFLVGFDREGELLWRRRMGGPGEQVATALVVDPQDDITLLGRFSEQLDLGENSLVSTGSTEGFLARFASDGRPLWAHPFRTSMSPSVHGMAVNRAGDLALTGSLPNEGTPGHFVAKFDTRGQLLWSKNLDDASARHCCRVIFDKSGHVIVATAGPVSGPSSIVLTRLAPDGRILWSRDVGRFETFPDVTGLAMTSDGRIGVLGTLEGSADFGEGPFSGLGGDDLFVLEVTSDGTLSRVRRFGDAADQRSMAMTMDGWGNLIFAGRFTGDLELGHDLLKSDGPMWFIARRDLLRPSTSRAPEGRRCARPPAGLVAWYPFRGPEPGTLEGRGPRGRLLKGASLVPGRAQHVLRLDGGFFEVPDSASLDFGRGSFSLMAWLQTTDTDRVRIILDKRKESPGEGPVWGYSLYLYKGRLGFQLADGRGHGRCSMFPASSCTNYMSGHLIADGAWHLVVVTVDRGELTRGTFYVDGVAVDIVPFGADRHTGSIDNDYPLRIGSRSSEETGLFRGLVDDVALWNRVLSPTEVADLYRAGSAGLCEDRQGRAPAGKEGAGGAGTPQPWEPLPRP